MPTRSIALCVLALLSLFSGRARAQQSAAVLPLERGNTIALLGNALAERMQHHGWFETRLQARFPELELSVRNLGFGADELDVHQRTMNFGKFSSDPIELDLPNERFVPWDRYLDHVDASVVLAFFGYNESFAGAAGIPAFREKLSSFVDHVASQTYDGRAAPTLVLVGSIPQEDHADANLPDGEEHNARIELYNRAMGEVARDKGVRFVDPVDAMRALYAAADERLTINGIHLTERGNREFAAVLEAALFGAADTAEDASLRAMVLEKNGLWYQRYRATDGYNVYGDRSRLAYETGSTTGLVANYEVLQRELDHLDVLTANRDGAIHAIAGGRAPTIDDSNAPPLIGVPTNKPGDEPGGAYAFLSGTDSIAKMTTAPGMRIELFADERQFPELVNPVQMAWDTRGRLWVATWQTYPHWRPDLPMNDKLLVLEDTDGDGRANTCEVFADDLHNPTGFEFWNGGVLLAQTPDLVFLKDTDGDGRADTTERLLHGLSTADTHHAANSFVLGPDGALYFQEGTFHRSQVESIHGPVRNIGGCVWRYEPRTHRVERYIPYNYANPHGHVFDRWGQDFMTDGTGNVNYYSLPFSGFLPQPLKHSNYFPFFKQRSRPAGATEILSSAHFPAENQGNYLIANVIGFRGVFQYRIVDDGAGFGAVEVDPIVESTDLNFRPVDLEVGPDGALYVLDWHNPLIGHMQHHLRDPSRDADHGRVYRVTYEGRELTPPAPIAGAELPALLELLKSPDDRVRYRVRIELSGRDSDEVVAATRAWCAGLDETDADLEHHLLEGLWVHAQHNRMDRALLERLLAARDPRARAAAIRALRYGRHLVPDALELLAPLADDVNARCRLEAVVAASFFDSPRAATVALAVLRHPLDKFLTYALGETMRALEPHWKAGLRRGAPIAAGNPAGIEYLLDRVTADELERLPREPVVLRAILTRHGPTPAARATAASELAELEGIPRAQVLIDAIRTVDAGTGTHAAHTLAELGRLLGAEESVARAAVLALAEDGRLGATRELGYAMLVRLDRGVELAWVSASRSTAGLIALFSAVPSLERDAYCEALGDRIRQFMFESPVGLGAERGAGPARAGLDVSVFEPAPADARIETFDALTPSYQLSSAGFGLDFDALEGSDSFGLRFDGILTVERPGRYAFATTSDDGSRLYIDGRCVVDNDGPHSEATVSGEVDLLAGAHPIRVTFFESGGAESLSVSWRVPGAVEFEPIPATALSSDQSLTLRTASIRAMARLAGRDDEKLAGAVQLVKQGQLLAPAAELLASVDLEHASPTWVRRAFDALVAHVGELSPERRTLPAVAAALDAGRALARTFDGGEREAALAALDDLGGTTIVIRTLRHEMRYDLGEFSVEAGKPVAIVFQNNDVMPHNLVVTMPGAMARVGAAAELLASGAGYVPRTDDVLWFTRLLLPGESERIAFVAPDTPGDHPYVCTYPGHWRVMNGVMHVVERLDAEARLAQRATAESPEELEPARAFVREWTLEGLVPLLADGWEQDRSLDRGADLFDAAGCIKCHTADDATGGATGGPKLTAIREKYRGVELLRHVLEPSLDIADEYKFYIWEVDDGPDVIGRVLTDEGDALRVLPTLLEPDNVVTLDKRSIVERFDTRLSPMPTGLLVTLTAEEILDLLAYLQSTKD